MDFRKTFDRIPEAFDKYRPRYCTELYMKSTFGLSNVIIVG